MNNEVKNINVNDFEVVREPKEKPTLWETLKPEYQKRLNQDAEKYGFYQKLVTKLKENTNYYFLDLLDYSNVCLSALGTFKMIHPTDMFKDEN